MNDERNNAMTVLRKLFENHLTEQYKKGYLKGLEVGSKTFIAAIKDMIENEEASTQEILEFCNKALGTK